MLLPLPIIVGANAVFLVIAVIAALVIVRASISYRRHIGDNPAQQHQVRIILYATLLIIIIGLAAAALNLFAA